MAGTSISESVGNLYFNVVDVPCFVFKDQQVRKTKNIFEIHKTFFFDFRVAPPSTGGDGVLCMKRVRLLFGKI